MTVDLLEPMETKGRKDTLVPPVTLVPLAYQEVLVTTGCLVLLGPQGPPEKRVKRGSRVSRAHLVFLG